jgi:hypothetical protein
MAAAHVELGLLLTFKTDKLSEESRAELNEGLRLNPNLRSLIPAQYLNELR